MIEKVAQIQAHNDMLRTRLQNEVTKSQVWVYMLPSLVLIILYYLTYRSCVYIARREYTWAV